MQLDEAKEREDYQNKMYEKMFTALNTDNSVNAMSSDEVHRKLFSNGETAIEDMQR